MSNPPLGEVIPALHRILKPLGVPVVEQIPNPRPERFLRLEYAGGDSEGLLLERHRIIVHAWDKDAASTWRLARDARHLILTAAESDDLIHDAEATLPASLPHPDAPADRAVFYAQLTII